MDTAMTPDLNGADPLFLCRLTFVRILLIYLPQFVAAPSQPHITVIAAEFAQVREFQQYPRAPSLPMAPQ